MITMATVAQASAWDGFPFDERLGMRPNSSDTPPQRTPEGDFVLWHGTSRDSAANIVKEKRIRPDDLNVVGVGTHRGAVSSFSVMKGKDKGVAVRAVVDKDWLVNNAIVHREVGGSGHDQFLIQRPHGTPRAWDGVPIKSATVHDGDGQRVGAKQDDLVKRIQDNLSDDLRHKQYQGNANPHAGHCYVASEAYYHMAGGKNAGLKPMFIHHEGEPHWFIRDSQGKNIDLTSSQFKTPVPYDEARGKGFLTDHPSARAQTLINRVNGVIVTSMAARPVFTRLQRRHADRLA